jgi:hypothetical protein
MFEIYLSRLPVDTFLKQKGRDFFAVRKIPAFFKMNNVSVGYLNHRPGNNPDLYLVLPLLQHRNWHQRLHSS